jgi:hypothetical protein
MLSGPPFFPDRVYPPPEGAFYVESKKEQSYFHLTMAVDHFNVNSAVDLLLGVVSLSG